MEVIYTAPPVAAVPVARHPLNKTSFSDGVPPAIEIFPEAPRTTEIAPPFPPLTQEMN